MKVQACIFKRVQKSVWEDGIAYLKDFGIHDVHFILDRDGKRLKNVWTFNLQEGTAKRIDTNL